MVAPRAALLKIDDRVEAAVRSLVSCDLINGRYRVGLPVVSASGSRMDVSIWPEPDGRFTVSDDGAAFHELGGNIVAERIFSALAPGHAASYGVTFSRAAFTINAVSEDRLRGALIAISNLSREVLDETTERLAKAKKKALRDELFRRLNLAFPTADIAHDATVHGNSTASYNVAAIVKTADKETIFDVFTRDPISIAAEFTKLSDLFRLEDAPRLVAVTREPEKVGPKLQLIASVAPIISVDVDLELYRKLAA